jgi:hypothetical protein
MTRLDILHASSVVMAGLVPAIHVRIQARSFGALRESCGVGSRRGATWTPATSAGMTIAGLGATRR